MAIREYIGREWRDILRHNHADSFEQLWALDADHWFEPPNHRRGGWSGVVRTKLALPDGSAVGIFIKRQENHFFRDWKHLFLKRPTFERERDNIVTFARHGIPSLELLYYGQRKIEGNIQAILITRALDGYRSLDDPELVARLHAQPDLRKKLIADIAQTLREMHAAHLQHNCFYPKHVFVAPEAEVPVRVIDLEKVKWRPIRMQAVMRDLDTLNRHAQGWSRTDRIRLFLAYQQAQKLSSKSKQLLKSILALSSHKSYSESILPGPGTPIT